MGFFLPGPDCDQFEVMNQGGIMCLILNVLSLKCFLNNQEYHSYIVEHMV
jgi:hypothetical protein